MNPGYEYLSVQTLDTIMDALQDVREMPSELLFLNRTPITPANDGEIMGRWLNRVQIADLVTDDARAYTYAAGRVITETNVAPNIKIGHKLTQETINQIIALGNNPNLSRPGVPNQELGGNVVPSIVENLRTGIWQRAEALIVAMFLDSTSYDRFGVKISGTWGTPSDLKVNLTTPWTNKASATPVDNFWSLKRIGSVRYGATFNRATMSTTSFTYMTNTDEFISKARTTLPLWVNLTSLPQANTELMRTLATNILGVDQLELYDQRYWSQDSAGNMTSAPYLPVNKVILSNSANDNNTAAYDFGNAITTESLLATFLPNQAGLIGNFSGGQRGPLCYTTVSSQLDPPNMTVWGVMKGFPRKFLPYMNAVLTVGQFTDSIPVGEPF